MRSHPQLFNAGVMRSLTVVALSFFYRADSALRIYSRRHKNFETHFRFCREIPFRRHKESSQVAQYFLMKPLVKVEHTSQKWNIPPSPFRVPDRWGEGMRGGGEKWIAPMSLENPYREILEGEK